MQKSFSLSSFSQAEIYIELGQWGKAERLLLKSSHRNPVALYQLSQVFLERGETLSAREVIRRGLVRASCLRPRLESSALCGRLATQRGDVFLAEGKLRSAKSAFLAALRFAPSAGVLHSLGAVCHAQGDLASARRFYARSAKLNPDNDILMSNWRKLRRMEQKMGFK